jgi:TPP-dependent pyruvate/acetoin dehydrogenase alpha subunit
MQMNHTTTARANKTPEMPLTRQELLDLYYYMRLNRELEEQMMRLVRQNKILGGVYSSLGQEAISVGTSFALGPGDWIAPMIRNIGALLVRGFAPRDILTQHMGRYTSPTQGKDGTSHISDLHVRHVVSPISMLGELIPVMTGVAMAGRYLGQDIVAMTWIGDGGTSTGPFHEGLNLAAVQKAALVLIVENNQWAYSTPVERQVPIRDLADRAKAYGIASSIVDGNDVIAVTLAAREAVAHARSGKGPVLIEAKTMRMHGHAQHDGAEYVPRELVEAWKARDPLDRHERYLTENKLWDAKVKKEIDARITREIAADLEFAENSPFPPPESAAEGVYCEECHTVEAQWKRPKEDVMPPRASVKAPFWKVADAISAGVIAPTPARNATAQSGNGARPGKSKPAAKKSSASGARRKSGR